jgi:Flp pilus assembly protein TadD
MRRPSGLLFFLTTAFFALFLLCHPLAAQRRPGPSPFPGMGEGEGTWQMHAFTVSGMVWDAQSRLRIDGVRVDLRSFSGGTLATAFTGGNGSFQFNNVGAGNYELVFEQMGYEDARERVEVDGPVFGVTVQLRKLGEEGAGASDGKLTVSVRELSIPQKAREAMSKGMGLLYQKSDYPGSIKQFQRAIDAFPNYYEALAQMGLAYVKMKDATRAEDSLRKSAELSQERYPDAFFLLAALFSSSGKFADAEQEARKAVELDPNSWHAQSEMAHALFGLQRANEAETYAQAAVKLRPDNPTLYLLLADIHMDLRNSSALLEDLNSYLKLAPNGPFADQARRQRDELQQRSQNSEASPPDGSPTASAARP